MDDAHDIDVVMLIYNSVKYSGICSKTGILWEHYRDEPSLESNSNTNDFSANNNSILLKFKGKIKGQTGKDGTKDVEIMVPLKNLSNFWRILEMPLINFEINLQLTWSRKCFLIAGTAANQDPKIKLTDTKLYVPVATSSTQDNVKLLKQLNSGFKRTINWNKYHFKITT